SQLDNLCRMARRSRRLHGPAFRGRGMRRATQCSGEGAMSFAAARVERALWIACPILLFVVMFAHMTAVVYVALGLLAIGTLAAAGSAWRRPEASGTRVATRMKWPLALPIAAWAAWTLASIGWSFAPSVTLHAWFDEVFYPLVAFWAFWLLGTKSARPE